MYDLSTTMRGHITFSDLKWNYCGYYVGNMILMYEEEGRGKANRVIKKKKRKQEMKSN